MARFDLDSSEIYRLEDTIKQFPGNAEKSINTVLHGEGAQIIQDKIRRLMPVSGKTWAKKKAPAIKAKSMRNTNENLAVIVRSTTNYNYLYFPDDGSNTRRHVGNQHFFQRGGESSKTEVIDRCINQLIDDFNNAK